MTGAPSGIGGQNKNAARLEVLAALSSTFATSCPLPIDDRVNLLPRCRVQAALAAVKHMIYVQVRRYLTATRACAAGSSASSAAAFSFFVGMVRIRMARELVGKRGS